MKPYLPLMIMIFKKGVKRFSFVHLNETRVVEDFLRKYGNVFSRDHFLINELF